MLLRFQKAAVRGDYETGNQAFSMRLRFLTIRDIRSQSSAVFSEVAACLGQTDGLTADGHSESMGASYVTGNYFQMMGLKPALGDFIAPASGKSVASQPILVLGYSFWQARFGGDPGVIGKSVFVNGRPFTIIGVAPRGFHGIPPLLETQGYLPLEMATVTADASKDLFVSRRAGMAGALTIIARLKPGVTLAAAQPVLDVIVHRLSTQYPTTDKWKSVVAYALGPMSPISNPGEMNTFRLISGLFLTLAGLVLILACLNIANLLLVRASGRQREMAVRAAVGCARSRLVRQLLTESLLLASVGCAAGLALGLIASRWLSSINLNIAIPFVMDFQFDWRVFTYSLGAALWTALVIGIGPALRTTRGDLNNLLHESARTATSGHQRARSVLVVAQVGGSLMLLIVAGLFVRSLRSVEHTNLGFDQSHVLNFTVNAHQAGYDDAESRNFLKSLLPRICALPEVDAASLAVTVPMGTIHLGMELKIDGYRPLSDEWAPSAGYDAVSPQYFQTMQIPILHGRGFLVSDTETSPYVGVINEAMAEEYWHGKDPIGRHFTSTNDPKHSIEVVGIAKNSRAAANFSSPIGPYLYVPLLQHYDHQLPVTLQLRTSLSPAAVNREVVGVIHLFAPTIPVVGIQTMTEALDGINGFMLFQCSAGLAASLGILGLTLAVVGVYGVVSYGASQRTHEIGIRMALGAQPTDVLQMIVRQGSLIVGAGLIAGVLAAAAIARLVGNFLSGVSPVDPLTYVSASSLLSLIALVACYIPARRASRVDPTVSLRHE
jgi:predicted permease